MVFRAPQEAAGNPWGSAGRKVDAGAAILDTRGITLHEINLEKHRVLDSVFATLDIAAIVRELQVIGGRRITAEGSVLFLDEIQATPHAIATLRYFYEEAPELAVIAASSLLEFALSDHSFSMPVGRVEYFRMKPVTFMEYLSAIDSDLRQYVADHQIGASFPESAHRKLVNYQKEFLVLAGMPEVVQAAIDGALAEQMVDLRIMPPNASGPDAAPVPVRYRLISLPLYLFR